MTAGPPEIRGLSGGVSGQGVGIRSERRGRASAGGFPLVSGAVVRL